MIEVGSPQFLYMAEAEGLDNLVDTHEAKLNAVLNDLIQTPEAIFNEDWDAVREAMIKHDLNEITNSEWEQITRIASRYWR